MTLKFSLIVTLTLLSSLLHFTYCQDHQDQSLQDENTTSNEEILSHITKFQSVDTLDAETQGKTYDELKLIEQQKYAGNEMFMQMYFYMGTRLLYLFKPLKTTNTGTYILCLVITFIIAVAIEGLNFLRYNLQASAYSKLNKLIDRKDNSVYTLSCQIRFLISLTYLLSIFLSYMLMLIVMTYNGGIFIVTILGLTTGYFLFGFIRKTKYTRIYNPEGDKCCAEVDG